MKPLRLIIVEDSEDDMLLLLLELKRGGYEPDYIRVETAEDLKKALQDGSWDLIISDHAMPYFSSPEALVILQESGLDLPLIIVSSIIGEEVAVSAMKAGAHDYIMKNNLARLVPVVERALYDARVRSERRKMEAALRESEARFRRLADNARDLIYRINLVPERSFEYVSPSVEEIVGYTPEDHYSNPNLAYEIIHEEDRCLLDDSTQGKWPLTEPLVLRWIHKNGSVVWVEQRNVPIYNQEGVLVAIEGIARDVTDRVLSEQELKRSHAQIEALSGRILTAMEDERSRLARELHDELGQALTAVKLDLQLLGYQLNVQHEQKKKHHETIELVNYTINLVRRQALSLRPPALDDMGLLPAINEMVRGFMTRTGILTKISTVGLGERLPGYVETALYRCVQESLTNVARHARADNVAITINQNIDFISITVSDDGIGFNPEDLKVSSAHIGLTGIQERVKLLSGELKINSAKNMGTKVSIKVPRKEHAVKEIMR